MRPTPNTGSRIPPPLGPRAPARGNRARPRTFHARETVRTRYPVRSDRRPARCAVRPRDRGRPPGEVARCRRTSLRAIRDRRVRRRSSPIPPQSCWRRTSLPPRSGPPWPRGRRTRMRSSPIPPCAGRPEPPGRCGSTRSSRPSGGSIVRCMDRPRGRRRSQCVTGFTGPCGRTRGRTGGENHTIRGEDTARLVRDPLPEVLPCAHLSIAGLSNDHARDARHSSC